MSKISIVTSFYCQPPSFVDELYENIKKVNVDWEWIVTDDFSPTPEIDERLTQISNRDVRVRKILQKSKRETKSGLLHFET
jgi:RNA-binding protein YlmH